MGHGHRQHHLGQQLPGAAADRQHLFCPKDAAQGVEGVVVADLHHGGTGGHGGGEQLGIHGANADRQPGNAGGQAHQLRITGHVQQVGTAPPSGAGDALYRSGVEVGQAGDHLQQTALDQGGLQRNGQVIEARHAINERSDSILPPLAFGP